MVVAFTIPPPHPGRVSSSSGRARHSSMIGASRDQSAICSMSSRNFDSPQWMSSNTRTSGWRVACASKKSRMAQSVSSGAALPVDRPMASTTLSATNRAWSTPASTAAILPRAISCGSASVSPAACPTTSATGQNVIPSPYERHRPCSTRERSSAVRRNSSTRRDFPIPGGPRTVKSWHRRSATTRSKVCWSRTLSRSRSTSGESNRRTWPDADGETLNRRWPTTGPIPFSESEPASSTATASRTSL